MQKPEKIVNSPHSALGADAGVDGVDPPARRIVDTNAVIDRLSVGVVVFIRDEALKLETIFANEHARSLFSVSDSNPISIRSNRWWDQDEAGILEAKIQDVFASGLSASFDWNLRLGAVDRYLASQVIPLNDADGQVYQVICTIEDQTAEKLAERNLLHHAFHDALTGLPNRVLFRSRLEEAVAESQKAGFSFGCAVLIVNIDRFQQINESFGHSAGDRFLAAMATTLRRCIRTSDTLARLSGDEFAILVGKCQDLDEVVMISDRIHDAMKLPYDLDGNEVFTSVSIGIATTLSSAAHPEDLIRDADFAMHAAKVSGKSRSEVYARETHQRTRSQFHLETELRRAVGRGELSLNYQPIIELDTRKIVAFEGLARWNHHEQGFVSPVEFIPLAEETGIIVDLGRWAIDSACIAAKSWISEHGDDAAVPVNVNVSAVQFARDDVVGMVRKALDHHHLSGDYLRVEITESTFITNPARITDTLEKLRSMGVRVALDDFGTGYSSLNYLHQFPIDIIKIDRSFINQLAADNQQFKILKMIAMLAQSLNYKIVAEGVEDETHEKMLKDLEFNYAQGFFYSRPVVLEDASNLIRTGV